MSKRKTALELRSALRAVVESGRVVGSSTGPGRAAAIAAQGLAILDAPGGDTGKASTDAALYLALAESIVSTTPR